MKLDSKFMAMVLIAEGFIRWAEGKQIQITDVKPEYRDALMGNFVTKVQGR